MLHIFTALVLIVGVFWIAYKFYIPTEMAEHPEDFPTQPEPRISKKDLAVLIVTIDRWREEGKISREEYEKLAFLCQSECEAAKPLPQKPPHEEEKRPSQ